MSMGELSGAATVNVDAAVGIVDVYNTGIEAVEQTAKNDVVIWKTFSHLNKIASR